MGGTLREGTQGKGSCGYSVREDTGKKQEREGRREKQGDRRTARGPLGMKRW